MRNRAYEIKQIYFFFITGLPLNSWLQDLRNVSQTDIVIKPPPEFQTINITFHMEHFAKPQPPFTPIKLSEIKDDFMSQLFSRIPHGDHLDAKMKPFPFQFHSKKDRSLEIRGLAIYCPYTERGESMPIQRIA